MLHGDFRGMFDLVVCSIESGDECTCGHGACDTHLPLTSDFRTGDRGVLFIEHADCSSSKEIAINTLLVSIEKSHVVMSHGGDDSSRSVCGGCHNAPPGGVLLVYGNGPHIQPVHAAQ